MGHVYFQPMGTGTRGERDKGDEWSMRFEWEVTHEHEHERWEDILGQRLALLISRAEIEELKVPLVP